MVATQGNGPCVSCWPNGEGDTRPGQARDDWVHLPGIEVCSLPVGLDGLRQAGPFRDRDIAFALMLKEILLARRALVESQPTAPTELNLATLARRRGLVAKRFGGQWIGDDPRVGGASIGQQGETR